MKTNHLAALHAFANEAARHRDIAIRTLEAAEAAYRAAHEMLARYQAELAANDAERTRPLSAHEKRVQQIFIDPT